MSFSKNPLGVRATSMSTGSGSLNGSANLFTAALASIQDTTNAATTPVGVGRFGSHLMQGPSRHASLSGLPSYVTAEPQQVSQRGRESIDALSPSFGGFGFHPQQQAAQRSFSPNSTHYSSAGGAAAFQQGNGGVGRAASVSVSVHAPGGSSFMQHQHHGLLDHQPQQQQGYQHLHHHHHHGLGGFGDPAPQSQGPLQQQQQAYMPGSFSSAIAALAPPSSGLEE